MTKKNDISANSLKIPKVILITAKLLEVLAPKFAVLFAARLFTSPIKHKIPKREFHMLNHSNQEFITIPPINKKINVYHYGKSERKVLLVHGWSGRGTQLVKIADELLKLGFSVVSFDAPAHGRSGGRTTLMSDFIASILELEKLFGPFEFAIGHSLGSMSILNAIKQSFNVKKVVIIGSGDIIQDIIDDFVRKLQMNPEIGNKLRYYFEKKYGLEMNSFSASRAAESVEIPVLIIHDENDDDVPVKAAHHIHQHLKISELLITQGLGHRKILGNAEVMQKIIAFMTVEVDHKIS
jgi:pimeloyl-ACP methyl ester carboxylesterase